MQNVRRMVLAAAASGAIAGCGAGSGAPSQIGSGQAHVADLGGTAFMTAVFHRLTSGTDRLEAGQGDVPAQAFRVLDANGDGTVTLAEWNRPVAEGQAQQYAGAYRPFAAATFKLVSHGRNLISYGDLSASGAQGLSARTFQALASGGAMDAKRFESLYPALSGSTVEARGIGSIIIGGYLKFAGFVGSEFMIHRPRNTSVVSPATAGYTFEQAWLKTEDGLPINTWYIPAAVPSNRCVVLVHGHGSNRSTWIGGPELTALHDAGINTVLIDLRRHGASGGEFITFALHEDNDVRAAVRYAESKGNTAIGAMGNSLGGASVIRAAATTPQIKAVWDDCGFASYQMAVLSAASNLHLPFLQLTIPAIVETGNRRVGEDMSRGDPDVWIQKIAPRPVYIVHGADDEYIFAENSRINYAAAKDPKFLWLVPGAGHGASSQVVPEEYKKRLAQFFSDNL